MNALPQSDLAAAIEAEILTELSVAPARHTPGAPGRTTVGAGFPPVARSGRGFRYFFSSSHSSLCWAEGLATLIARRDILGVSA